MDNNIKVTIWGKEVGRLTWDTSRKRSIFEYAPTFLKGELDIAPLTASIYDRSKRRKLLLQAKTSHLKVYMK